MFIGIISTRGKNWINLSLQFYWDFFFLDEGIMEVLTRVDQFPVACTTHTSGPGEIKYKPWRANLRLSESPNTLDGILG